MSTREVREIKIVMPDKTLVGKAIPVEPLFCTFCGKHICPGTQKIYFKVPFLAKSETEICSVQCIRKYFASDKYNLSDIKVIQSE